MKNIYKILFIAVVLLGTVSCNLDYFPVTDYNEGNVEVSDDSGWETRYPLELGATYVMTVTDCTPLDGDSKFNCTIDFRKK